ncbi:MAG: pentapeptide repeat-containing protein [Peptococcaceae bacterium]|nr:pentapeptide repeat-containing protein [Peptococcaceae bacterium]
MGLALQRVSFDNAVFRKAIFLQWALEQVSFSEASFDSGAFVETQADEVNFRDTVLISVAFAKETSLNRADFSRAKLTVVATFCRPFLPPSP